MIGIVIVSHVKLGDALIEAAEFILGSLPESTTAVSIDLNIPADKLRNKIKEGIKKVDQKDGILILTDMFGGTPSNLSYSFLEEGRIEVISGVNLPVLMKSINSREKMDLSELAQCVADYGKNSISLASRILRGNKRATNQ